MPHIPFLWYEYRESDSVEVSTIKHLLEASKIPYNDTFPAVEVGPANIEIAGLRFYGVEGTKKFIEMSKSGKLEKLIELQQQTFNV